MRRSRPVPATLLARTAAGALILAAVSSLTGCMTVQGEDGPGEGGTAPVGSRSDDHGGAAEPEGGLTGRPRGEAGRDDGKERGHKHRRGHDGRDGHGEKRRGDGGERSGSEGSDGGRTGGPSASSSGSPSGGDGGTGPTHRPDPPASSGGTGGSGGPGGGPGGDDGGDGGSGSPTYSPDPTPTESDPEPSPTRTEASPSRTVPTVGVSSPRPV